MRGRLCWGGAALDDVMGVVLLALLYEFSLGGGVSFLNVGKVLVFVAVFFVLAPIAAKLISLFDSYHHCFFGFVFCLAGVCDWRTGTAGWLCCWPGHGATR